MRVVIDATVLREGRITGLERYTMSLIDTLLRFESGHEWHILLRAAYEPPWRVREGVFLHWSPYGDRVRTDQIWVPRMLAGVAPSIVHFPAFAPPLRLPKGVRVVWTIHDAVFWRYPQTLSLGGRAYYRPLVNRALNRQRCDLILTVSRAAATDLRDRVPDDIPIRVIPHGLAESFHPSSQRPRHGLARYILTVGTAEPRKNIAGLLLAYQMLREKESGAPPLVIVGRDGWGRAAPRQDGSVRRLEGVSDEELPSLYAHCAAFVLPSLYEGFGLPLLEAMACGAPCIASDIPALREVGGEACVYVAARDVSGLAAALRTVLADNGLAAGLRVAAQQRSSEFSWVDCARETLDAYEAVAAA